MPLFIVATPIGNLDDVTLRALATLKSVDLIAAEDTRTTRILCERHEIKTPLISFHAHSSKSDLQRIIKELRNDKSVALVSDAGTPGISDPGFRLVYAAVENKIKVVPIPGVSAVVTALSASGLSTNKFIYLGFLPLKKGRQTLFQNLYKETRTVVFYESPHRIEKTLTELEKFLGGERIVVIARELTKIYEEFFRGTLYEAIIWIRSKPIRGEFTVVLNGAIVV